MIASNLGMSNVIVCLPSEAWEGVDVAGEACGNVVGVEGFSNICVGTLAVVEGSYNLNVGVVTITPSLGANVGACTAGA